MKSLVRLIYVSRMTEECDMDALEKILKVSRKKNKEKDITGMLCYDPKFFMQCLEGPKEAVNDLYGEIARDRRHTHVTLLEYEVITERMFGKWSMAFIRAGDVGASLYKHFGGSRRFNPFSLTPEKARDFFAAIAPYSVASPDTQ
ncbi:MAG TPA: BLUF domain-containing protein [Candidatus Hydrogenedentes bacterium]|nr:BLUF domain-containing protein [Candidatus Hydrogenedentota bacterium]HRT20066.1 BLUF domain-containing protein [Candidatus Hydrogenedentota bacterium]HRT64870.1 BLUF domain-containing protein [Candidatus Hydrogenedentota bacterium]